MSRQACRNRLVPSAGLRRITRSCIKVAPPAMSPVASAPPLDTSVPAPPLDSSFLLPSLDSCVEVMDISCDSQAIESCSVLDTSVESMDGSKIESKLKMYENLLTSKIPESMLQYVPLFKPKGSMKRLQEVIELIHLNQADEDDCELTLDDLEDYDYQNYSTDTRMKAQEIAKLKDVGETFKLDAENLKLHPPKVYKELTEKHDGNANDVTLEIPSTEVELEFKCTKLEITNKNQNVPYSCTVSKKKKDLSASVSYRVHTECTWIQKPSLLENIVPTGSYGQQNAHDKQGIIAINGGRTEMECSRNFLRRKIKISQFGVRDSFDIRNKDLSVWSSIKPAEL